jgi:hypothetical protein
MFDLEYYNIICDYGKYIKETQNNYIRHRGGQFKQDELKGKSSKKYNDNRQYSFIDIIRKYDILIGMEYMDWYLSWDKYINNYPNYDITYNTNNQSLLKSPN